MSARQEQNDKRIAVAVSVGLHTFLLVAFLLLMAWRAPNPPHPEFGIELNFGLDQQGGGEIQPETSPGSVTEEEKPEEQETPEEIQPQEEVKEQETAEEAVESVVSKEESPVVVKEEKKEPPKDVVKEKPAEAKPKVIPKEEKKEVAKEVANEGKATEQKKGDPTTSQGDDPGKLGDKGNPEGKLDAKALYGQPGGGGGGNGFGLSMSGWAWADDPKIPELPDNEDGRIEFEIECDENGDIVAINTIQRGLSARAEQLLKDEIRRNSLIRTSAGKVPERSKGKVVFILKTK